MRKLCKAWVGMAAFLMAMPVLAQQTAKEAEKEAGSYEQYDKILRRSGHHDILARLEGNWLGTLKVLIYSKDDKTGPYHETTMKDTLEARMILNGNFYEANYTTDIEGTLGHGKIVMGYNGAEREFYRLYMNEGEPRGTLSTGVHIRSQNALHFRGVEHDPVSGDKFEKRDVFTFGPDKDKFHYEMSYTFADGSVLKVAEGDYVRIKDGTKPEEKKADEKKP